MSTPPPYNPIPPYNFDQQQNSSPMYSQQQQGGFQQQQQNPGFQQQQQNPGFQQQQLTPEERSVMKECTDESFYYRSLPLSLGLGFAARVLVQKEILKPSLRYGATPKMVLFGTLGYFLGKFTYVNVCAEKFLNKAPRSAIASAIRQRRGMPPLEPVDEPTQSDYGGLGVPQSSTNIQPDLFTQSQNEIPPTSQQTSPSSYEELRQRNRETIAPPVPYPGQTAPPGAPLSGYDEMRRRNREQGGQSGGHFESGGYQQQQPPPLGGGQYIAPPPAPYVPSPAARAAQGTGKYGDEGFE
eukprot:TRINITY_DN6046_c0_g1_i4.p1 TRINITY_DN6046_c0_g1~~TRINITY_DN6046_c0_g1_i4.p1  ORF type:complete len:307 (+),score=63.51 TRINITY_DN6046_c0_g1_i4:32-922(+)